MKYIISESQYTRLLEDDNWWYDISKKLKILKSYINILKSDDESRNILAISYFRVLYNFLIIERMFYPDVVAAKKEINKYLELDKLSTVDEVQNKFKELYDIHHPVRNSVELLTNIETIGDYVNGRPEIFKKLLKP
jgi:hypothetical protein